MKMTNVANVCSEINFRMTKKLSTTLIKVVLISISAGAILFPKLLA